MTTKKESEQEKQAVIEEKVAQLHKKFPCLKLAPEELIAPDEPSISPALHFDDSEEETLPIPQKPAKPSVRHKPVAAQPKDPELKKPVSKPKTEPDKEALGAAGFLLSGMVPEADSKDKSPTTKKAEPSKQELGKEEGAEKKKLTTPTIKDTDTKDTATPTKPSVSKTQAIAPETANKPKEKESHPPKDDAVKAEAVSPKTQSQEKEEETDGTEGEGGKSGVFAKAKSLLATITKKDKK